MGGVVVLSAIVLLLVWFLRKRSRKEEFDGNFDPDRVVLGGRDDVDLAGDVEPYSYTPGGGGASGSGGGYGQEMSQHGGGEFLAAGAAGAGAYHAGQARS